MIIESIIKATIKNKTKIFLILLILVTLLISKNYFNSFCPKELNNIKINKNSNLVYDILTEKKEKDVLYLEGFVFDPELISTYDNYISGKGIGFISKYKIVLINKNSTVFLLYSKPMLNNSIPLIEGFEIFKSGFYSKVNMKEIGEGPYIVGFYSSDDNIIIKTEIEIH